MTETDNTTEVLEVASIAGHILLENGAEISRVEDTMERIASHYGVDSGHFFVLSNGIFTTGSLGKYANVEFIPIRGIQLSKVVAVNKLSYEIAAGKHTLSEARQRLDSIKDAPAKPAWEQIAGSAFGAAGFCAVFGGGFMDCAADFVIGALLYIFCLYVSGSLSKIVGGICNALVATILCLVSYRLGFGDSLSNIIIGAVMPLIPGVPFVNGVRDLANSDYIAGLTRLTDAMLGFICIALGVSISFIADGWIFGGMIKLSGMTVNPQTAGILWQCLAAFIGTFAFAILFGAPRKQYVTAGAIGAFGWVIYLLLTRFCHSGPTVSITIATIIICILSRFAAVRDKCPSTVYLLCGIFPLVPGAGIFWFTYYLVSSQFYLSATAGFAAVKAAIAIVLGIIVAMELPQRFFSGKRKH
ncbi:MAG TPA: hypothetical protein DDX40_03545 [Rikenellaceae bacterium]|nr:hypothetical protein [Rikenellaceae bacterium]